MRRLLPGLGALLTVYSVASVSRASGQDIRAFADVPVSDHAYAIVSELQKHDIVTGYPTEYFAGKKTLTRYEFGVVLRRALDKLQYSGAPGVEEAPGKTATSPAALPTDLVVQLQVLVQEFTPELTSLGADLKEVGARLDQLAHRMQQPSIPMTLAATDDLPFFSNLVRFPVLSIGYSSSNLFGNSNNLLRVVNTGGATSAHPLTNTFRIASSGMMPPSNSALTRSRGTVGVPGSVSIGVQRILFGGQNTDLKLDLPFAVRGMLGVSIHDTSTTGDLLLPNPYRSLAYGTNIRMNPIGRLTIGAEATRNILEYSSTDAGQPINWDGSSYLVKLGYSTGPASAEIGYRLGDVLASVDRDPLHTLSPMNTLAGGQGPYTRLAWRFSERLQSYFGSDYYGNAGLRSNALDTAYGPFFTGNIYRSTAGIRWNPTRRISLTADFEGVLYDLSGAVSSSGRRLQPVEQYISLGAGLDLPGNTILKMVYRIYNQQDSGSGADGFSNPAHASVFTTQLGIKF